MTGKMETNYYEAQGLGCRGFGFEVWGFGHPRIHFRPYSLKSIHGTFFGLPEFPV